MVIPLKIIIFHDTFLFLYEKVYHDFILMIKKTEYVLFKKNIMIMI